MQLLIFLTLWIVIPLGGAIDDLDIDLYDNSLTDPSLLGPGTNLFADASESDLSLFPGNEWDLMNPHTTVSFMDGMDGDSDPLFNQDNMNWDSDPFWTDDNGEDLNLLLASQDDVDLDPGSPWVENIDDLLGLFRFSFLSFFFFFGKLTLSTSIYDEVDSSFLIAGEIDCDATASSDVQPFGKVRRGNACPSPPVGQAEQPQKPEDPNNSQEPNDYSKVAPYIDILRGYLTEDYKTCPGDRFGSSNIPVCFNDIYRDQYMLPTPPYGHALLGVIPGACMHDFFFSFLIFFFFLGRGVLMNSIC